MKFAVVVVALLGTSVLAETPQPAEERSLDGLGRLGFSTGYRWVPNNYFFQRAADAGYAEQHASPGGPQLAIGFGYGATAFIEGAVDLFLAYEQLKLKGMEPLNAFSYGAVFGFRAGKMDFPVRNLAPYIGFEAGPTLGIVSSDTYKNAERVTTGYLITAGLAWRFNDRFAITLDVRYMIARSYVTGIGGVNVGGLMISLGLNTYFQGQSNKSPTSDIITPIE